MNYSRNILVSLVAVLVVSVLSGCTTPSGNAALWKTPNGTEVGSLTWGNAGLAATNAQHTTLHSTIDERNIQEHDENTQEEDNTHYQNLASKKTKIVLKKAKTTPEATTLMNATFGLRATKEN